MQYVNIFHEELIIFIYYYFLQERLAKLAKSDPPAQQEQVANQDLSAIAVNRVRKVK